MGIIQVYPYVWDVPGALSGGQLIIDNGTITSSTGLWYGISVMGNRHPQDPQGGTASNWQAISQSDKRMSRATFKNATVKGTRFGVCNFDIAYGTGGAVYTGGGIIQAQQSKFGNSQGYAVWMQHYRNFIKVGSRTYYQNDRSFFQDCKFEQTTTAPSLEAFMCLHEVNGVSVVGNTFTVSPSIGGKNLNVAGILIDNAGVTVDRYCSTPYLAYGTRCSNGTPSVFNNLRNGIVTRAWAQNGSYRVNVQNTTFNNCRNGIDLANTNQAILLENTFNITPDNVNNHTAIFLGGSTGYYVEGNKVNVSAPGANSKTYGITVKSSGSAPNRIYRNTIKNARYALQAIDLNRNLGTSAEGLRFLCNQMSNTVSDAYDITVVKSTPTATAGIAGLQSNFVSGSPADAGNSFSFLNNSNGPRNYVNEGLPIVYIGYIPFGGYSGSVSPVSGLPYGCPNTYGDAAYLPIDASTFLTKKSALETAMESDTNKMKELIAEYTRLHYNMLDVYYGVWDTSGSQDLDSARWVLSHVKYLPSFRIQKASLEAAAGDWDEALHTLATIPGAFSLSTTEAEELTQLNLLYQVGRTLAENEHDWGVVSSADKGAINDIAFDGAGAARFAARYYLSVYENQEFEPEVEALAGGMGKAARTGNDEAGTIAGLSASEKVALYPNPTANGEVNISGVANGTLYTVKDITGRVLLSGVLSEQANTLSLKSFAAGIYTLQLVDSGNKVTTFKISRQ